MAKKKTDSHPPAAPSVPAASFLTLLHTLGIQAMIALGEIESPMTGAQQVDLRQAHWHIDTIKVLQQKTAGNLSEEETSAIANVLRELGELLARKGG
jgi:hypothetical protein